MCKILYFICAKCYCGYARKTERCPAMHPPLIYCAKSTQFTFSVVPEWLCHLYPIHAPLLHLGDDGNSTVASACPPVPGPVSEAASTMSFAEESTIGSVVETSTPIPSEQPMPAPSIDARNNPSHLQGGINATGVQAQSTVYSGPANASSWHQSNSRAPTYYNHQEAGEQSNQVLYPLAPCSGSAFNGWYVNQAGPRPPSHLNSPYRPTDAVQYVHYPFQANPIPPFITGFRPNEGPEERNQYTYDGEDEVLIAPPPPPPGGIYLPVRGPVQPNLQHGSPASPVFQSGTAQTIPHMQPAYEHASGAPRFNQCGWDPTKGSPFNPQAPAFETQAHKSAEAARHELRRENLEQLQRSNAAAYNYTRYFYPQPDESTQHDPSAQNSESVLSSDSSEGGPVVGNSFLDNPYYWVIDFPEPGTSVRRDEGPHSGLHSWSGSSYRRGSVCDTLSVIEEESDKEAQLDDEESHSEDKGKEETRDSPCQSQTCQEPSEADVAGKGKETLQKHHLPGTMMAPPNTPAESCDECFGQDLPIATTSVSEVDKEPDVDRAPGNQTDQLGAYLGSEKLMNAIAVSETILDLAKAFGLKHLPPNIPALQLRAELASEMQSTCPVKNEPDASIKQDSDNEDEKSADLAEWTPKSIKTDPDDEVKLKDIPLLPDSIQEALGQAHAEDSEFDTDVEDWESAVGPPAVPPNSPVISAAPSNDGILTPQTSAECESQCSEKENHPPRPATIQLPEGHDDNSEPAIEGDDSGPSISQGKTLNNQLVPSEPVKALLDKIHLQGEDDKEVHKYHDVQDVDHPQPLTSKNAAPVSIRPAPKSWSAVVSGRFIPSQSSDPFPSKAPAYVSPWNNPILTGRPTSATEQLPAQPMATTSIPALEPQTLPDKTSKESNVSVRSDAPSEKMSWADEVQEETDRAGNEHAEEPKLAENSQFESEPEKIPPPPPNSPVKSWLMPEPCPRLEMLDYHVWESCRGMLMSEGNKEFLASTLAKGADSASVASHDSVAATDGTAHSTNDNASTEAVQGSSANSFADNSSTKATQGSPPSSTVDEIESTEDAGDCPRIQSMPCTTSLPLVSETDLIEFSTSSPTPEPIEAKGGCPKVQTMPCAKSLPLLEPNVLELADFPPLTQTKPVPSASTSTTPEVPAEPKKPLWSQILGRTGQAHSSEACSSGAGNPLATVKSKSEGNNDETDWPSLGSGSNKRK